MSIPSWPDTVNQIVNQDSFGEAPERNVASFQPPVGAAIERRRSSIKTNVFGFTSWFSSDEYDDLIDFYRNTLIEGVLTFTRNHPRTGSPAQFKFTDVPKISQVQGLVYTVSISLRLIQAINALKSDIGIEILADTGSPILVQ